MSGQGNDSWLFVNVPARSLTRHIEREDEPRQRPLDFRLIARLMESTQSCGAKRLWLLAVVVTRAIQLPALTWVLAAIIRGPVAEHDVKWCDLRRDRLRAAGDFNAIRDAFSTETGS